MAELRENSYLLFPFRAREFLFKKINHSLWFDERGSFEAVFVASV